MSEVYFINYKNSVSGTGGVGTVSRDLLKFYSDIHFVFSDSMTGSVRKQDINVRISDNKKLLWHGTYCKLHVWPIMHGITSKLSTSEILGMANSISCIANDFSMSFFEAINIRKDDIYWINDYIMAPVVECVRSGNTNATIVFSFRTPFLYGLKQELTEPDVGFFVRSVLKADIITFHRQSDLQNFIDTMEKYYTYTVSYISKKETCILTGDRLVTLCVVPMGNNKKYRRLLLSTDGCKSMQKQIRDKYPKKTIITGISRFEESKGLSYEIDLIDSLLEKNPNYIEKIVFLRFFYISQQKRNTESYTTFYKEILDKVDRINNKYQKDNWAPIILHNTKLVDEETAGLLSVTDVLLLTPLADGFNHLGIEAIYSHRIRPIQLLVSDIGSSDYIIGFRRATGDVGKDVATLDQMLQAGRIVKYMDFVQLLMTSSRLSSKRWVDTILKRAKRLADDKKGGT